jgi:inositol transporter-like SP family MFS transporter
VLFALGIFYVRETLGGGNVEFGWLMGLFGAGMVGGFFISQMKPPGGVMWMVRIALIVMGGVLIFMAVVSVLWVGYLAAVGFGTAFSVSVIVAMSAVQDAADDEHRGRVMGFVHMLFRGTLIIGALGAAGLATAVPSGGIDLPFVGYTPDKNQFALIVAGALIAGGTIGVRGRER